MSILYVDTSVVLGVYLKQKGYQGYRERLLSASDVVSSSLLVAEMAATFKREDIDLVFLQPCIESISIMYPHTNLINYYTQILAHGYCRGADLHHLACAISLDPKLQEIIFATYDSQQKRLAEKLGMQVL